ncbi:ABC transporter ATP-binding protein [Clostridium novyi A str. 4552]|uniref:ABC transporter ATP-binding protein n=1 Tax=Clostridium novyi A str. 4552 TaxID=1444289 RepID=A0A0A0I0I5_CLONO|nr:ABC transporter ATP-binding protein [Clostridium novyi]KGM94959.1 ABC transporter ATP-binding protein [Clostridium novyi A str. 4552]
MENFVKNKFALTEQGAKDLVKASFVSFLIYAINMVPSILLMIFIDELVLGNIKSNEFYIGFSIIVLVIMYLLLSIEYDFLYNATYKESANLRIDIAQRLSRLPLAYFSKHDLSDLSQTIMSDVEAIEHAMSHAIPKVLGFYIFFPLLSLMLIWGNLRLAFAVILPVILSFLLMYISKQTQLNEIKKHYLKLRGNSESFQETIEMGQDIKSFGLAEKFKRNLYKKMEDGEKLQLKSNCVQVIPVASAGIVMYISIAVVILIGTEMYISGEINILYLIGYLLAAVKIKELVDGITENMSELFYLDSRIKRIKEIRENEIQEGKEVNIKNFNIKLENVTFGYSSNNKILKGISFIAKQGEVTALVGMSGCGKTSILRLISRLYDYDNGKISIGNIDIKDISTKALFQKISIVFQDVTLFNTSIMENIRIGKKGATDEEVREAARLANCEEFVKKLPLKYNTLIGENGASLSGGERQRLSIARAFLKDAPIVILDEIAASLDVENENKIQESLNRLMKDKTVIIISHRLKSIENVDKIVVINDGKVECFGKHCELLEKSNLYKKLVEEERLVEEFKY